MLLEERYTLFAQRAKPIIAVISLAPNDHADRHC
jgi:hypothetical protein